MNYFKIIARELIFQMSFAKNKKRNQSTAAGQKRSDDVTNNNIKKLKFEHELPHSPTTQRTNDLPSTSTFMGKKSPKKNLEDLDFPHIENHNLNILSDPSLADEDDDEEEEEKASKISADYKVLIPPKEMYDFCEVT